MNYLIDPYIVQMPMPFDSANQIMDYFESLSAWSRFLDEPHENKFWFSEPALQGLLEAKRFPVYHQLQKVYDDVCDDEFPFDVVTASRACEKFYYPPFIDDEIFELCPDVENLLPEEKGTFIIPNEIKKRLVPDVAEALIQTFIKLAYIHEHCQIEVFEDLIFATRALDIINEQIELRSRCIDIETEDSYDFEAQWITISNPFESIDISEIVLHWKDTRWMVHWAYEDLVKRKILDKKAFPLPDETEWSVGSYFNESIEKKHLDKIDKLISIFHAVTKIIVRFWPRETQTDENHYLQKDHKQILRQKDGGLAWRVWVTKYRPHIRLHYWVIEDHVELSNVVTHNDFTIKS